MMPYEQLRKDSGMILMPLKLLSQIEEMTMIKKELAWHLH